MEHRFCLNIKGLAYKTVWVEYPDIEPVCKKIGAAPTSTKDDGVTPEYTLPVIYDPNTKRVVSDSRAIALYLDKTYPETLTLIPPGTLTLIKAFESGMWAVHSAVPRQPTGFVPIIIRAAFSKLREGSQPYFRETRERSLGPLEKLAPDGSAERAECWDKMEKAMSRVARWWETDKNGKMQTRVMGDDLPVSYADIILASWLLWFRETLGEENEEWRRMMAWDNGLWKQVVDGMAEYQMVDVGEDVQL